LRPRTALIFIYRKKLGGITGDLLGAMTEINEAVLFLAVCAGGGSMIGGHGGNIYRLAQQLGCRPSDISDMSANVNPARPHAGIGPSFNGKYLGHRGPA
jgi:hypothetical protein